MRLKTIKLKKGNDDYNELLSKTIKLIKNELNLNLKYNNLYFLTWFRSAMIFLYQDTVIVVAVEYDFGPNRSDYSSMTLDELYTIKLLKEYPKTGEDIWFKTIMNKSGVHWFNIETFLNWIDEPSQITDNIDEPYYKVISYLRNYNKTLFSTLRYNFYSKWDNDSNFITNIYAFDKKNKIELKIYIPDKFEKINFKWQLIEPKSVNDIAVDDLGQNISNYQKLNCKKEFLKISNEENKFFKVKNYWVMELVKQTIQPVDILHEWSCHRCFCDISIEGAIWVSDFLDENEEPYFFITDSPYLQDTTKIASFNFKNPKYHHKTIFKKDNIKRKLWILNKNEIDELIEFLNAKSEEIEEHYADFYKKAYKKYVKTNWQKLIFEYNHNTAGWGWSGKDFAVPPEEDITQYEALPFNLQIPDYTELLKE